MKIWSQIFSFFRKEKFNADMAEEMRLHLELQVEQNVAAGMSPEEARYAAQREFGNVASLQERAREQRAGRARVWAEQWGRDITFALRSLLRARSFTLSVLMTLILGIGVVATVFSLTRSILFQDGPYPQADQLYLIGYKDKQSPFTPVRTGLHFRAYQEQTRVFSEFAAVQREMSNVVIGGEPLAVEVLNASSDFFRTFGIAPVLGRGFRPEENRSGANGVVIISDLFWRKRFNADPHVLGRKLFVDQQACTVIGVLAPAQSFPPAFAGDVYRPLVMNLNPEQPFDVILFIIGRLKPGVSPETARAALAAVKVDGLPIWAGPYFAEQEVRLEKPNELAKPEAFWVMAIAATFLYAIACFNTINLMLVRLLGRQRELGIRLSLGATRGRIARLLFVESLLLALAVVLVLSSAVRWGYPPLFAAITTNEALRYSSYWDVETLGSIAVLSLAACLAAAILPVTKLLKTEVNSSLKESGPGIGESRRLGRIRNVLVMLQAAFAVILLTGTGLMVRTFEKVQHANLGFDPTGKVKVQVSFPKSYALSPESRLQLFERLQDRLLRVPGVRAAAFGQDTLLEGGFWGTAQLLMSDGSYKPVAGNFVSADFQKTAGLVLKRGRWLSGKPGVMELVINETLAKARFGQEDPVGKSIRLLVAGNADLPVVGVVGDVKETVRTAAPGMRLYTPTWVYPQNINTVLLRMDKNPDQAFGSLVQHVIYEFDPKLIVTNVSSIDEAISRTLWAERNAFMMLQGLTVFALGLVMVGLFSVLAYTVAHRRHEFGVRLALGATPADLYRLVLRQGLATAAIGVGLGIVASIGLVRFMQSLLFETSPYDPLVYLAVAAVLLLSAALACWLPARRAARVDPVIALRAE